MEIPVKEFPILEKHHLEFRFEAFNFLNHPNFGLPDSTLSDKAFGTITTTATAMREIQLALKYVFWVNGGISAANGSLLRRRKRVFDICLAPQNGNPGSGIAPHVPTTGGIGPLYHRLGQHVRDLS